jgi:hypothetical protein
MPAPSLLLELAELDRRLQQQQARIVRVEDYLQWRNSFQPPDSSWWWHFEISTPHWWERLDWLWNGLTLVFLAISLSLIADAVPRFLSGGLDTIGVLAVIIPSLLALLTSGALTPIGREARNYLFQKLAKSYWSFFSMAIALIFLLFLGELILMLPKLLIRSLILAVSLTLLPTVAQAGKNRIVELKGEAKIKLAGAINYQPVFKGMTLVLGDILLPNEGAEVIVNCSDGKRKQAQAGVPSGLKAICPGAKSTDPRGGSPIFINLLDGDFIARTLLLANESLLSWSPVSGATRYRVKVMANNEVIWEKTVEGTSVRYRYNNGIRFASVKLLRF